MAVYHYSASVSRQFHGPVQHDGVIICPVIAGPEGYSAAKALIASQHGKNDPLQVQVNSLSFVGETPASERCRHETWTDFLADCDK